ncbi:MAG: potassium channel family protein [Rhizomicrobium sp.]
MRRHEFHPSEYVREIWLERKIPQILAYVLGQLAYVSLPGLFVLLEASFHFRCEWAEKIALLCCPGLFTVLTVLTLFVPVGMRGRYKFRWLRRNVPTGYERMFLGQMPPASLFAAKGDGLNACLWEAGLYLLLIMLGAAATQFCVFEINNCQFAFYGKFNQLYNCLPHNPVAYGSPSPFTFLYFSVTTIFTVGYGDIAAAHWLPQLIVICEVFLGWMYLGAFFPALVAITAEHRDPDITAADGGYQRTLVQTSIHYGARWLSDRQQPTGGWNLPITPDALATAAAFAFITMQRGSRWHQALRATLSRQTKTLALPEDLVGLSAQRIAHDSMSPADLEAALSRIAATTDPEHHCTMIVSILGLLAGVTSVGPVRQHFPSDPEQWREAYGPHWNCYALVARIALGQSDLATRSKRWASSSTSRRCIDELHNLRGHDGSWYNDTLLTSLIGMLFCRLGIHRKDRSRAARWIRLKARSAQGGLPIFDTPRVWDTAWIIAALLTLIGESKITRDGIQWIINARCEHKKCPDKIGETRLWSWSDTSELACHDTTSLVCDVLRQAVIRDVAVDSVAKAVELELDRASHGHRWSTFDKGPRQIHQCPVISARCTRINHARHGNFQDTAESILTDVLTKNWTSCWHTDPAISDGLTLYYLAQVVWPTSQNMAAMVRRLCDNPITSVEGASAMVLGLLESTNSMATQSDLTDTALAKTRELTDYIVSRTQNHFWSGDQVGVFGFGRRYADSAFATSLALLALARTLPA